MDEGARRIKVDRVQTPAVQGGANTKQKARSSAPETDNACQGTVLGRQRWRVPTILVLSLPVLDEHQLFQTGVHGAGGDCRTVKS